MTSHGRIMRRWMVHVAVATYLLLIAGLPLGLLAALISSVRSPLPRLFVIMVSPALVVGTYVGVAGCLSRLTLSAIVAGHFPRDTGHSVYGRRRLYALCWTAVYYFPPIYHAVLAMPWFKRFTFRIFGYHGSTDFTIYPDTWLRDLPLLNIGEGCYLSNKATISPNMCLKNGKILIARVNLGAHAMIGHGTLIAPGVAIGAHAEVGVAGTVGVGTSIGDHTRVGHTVAIDHGVIIGSHCDIGSRSYIGRQTVVHDGLRVPAGAVIPAKQVLRTQSDVSAILASSHFGELAFDAPRPIDARTSGRQSCEVAARANNAGGELNHAPRSRV